MHAVADRRDPSEPAVLLTRSLKCLPPVKQPDIPLSLVFVFHSSTAGILLVSVCVTRLQIYGAAFLAVCVVVCLRSGGASPPADTSLPCPRSWESLGMSSRSRLLCSWIKLLCVVFLRSARGWQRPCPHLCPPSPPCAACERLRRSPAAQPHNSTKLSCLFPSCCAFTETN